MPVRQTDLENQMREQHEKPLDVADDYDAPQRPEKLYVKKQLRRQLERVTPNRITIEINTQFKTTYVKLRDDGETLAVNWDVFDKEEHYANRGWELITYLCKLELEHANISTEKL